MKLSQSAVIPASEPSHFWGPQQNAYAFDRSLLLDVDELARVHNNETSAVTLKNTIFLQLMEHTVDELLA